MKYTKDEVVEGLYRMRNEVFHTKLSLDGIRQSLLLEKDANRGCNIEKELLIVEERRDLLNRQEDILAEAILYLGRM